MRCALATIDRVADKADAARARPAPPRGERREEEALEPEGWSAAWAWVAEAARPTIADEDAETPDVATPPSDVATPPSDAEGTVHVEAAVRRVAPSPSPRVGVDAATSPPPAARRNRRGDEPSAFESEVRMETLRAELAGSVAAELRRELEPETRATLRDAVAAELRAELAGPVAAEHRKSLRAELAGSVAEELRRVASRGGGGGGGGGGGDVGVVRAHGEDRTRSGEDVVVLCGFWRLRGARHSPESGRSGSRLRPPRRAPRARGRRARRVAPRRRRSGERGRRRLDGARARRLSRKMSATSRASRFRRWRRQHARAAA